MLPDVNPEITRLFGRFGSQVDASPHPGDGLDRWRANWVKIRRLVDEIDQVDGGTRG